jgi:O-acetylserine/cysteine efflux transporter
MSRKDLTLGLAVVTVWGANFTVIKLGLDGVSPMLLAALRFALAAIPAIAFVPRPHVASRYLVLYGLTVGLGQFGCLFYAMAIGMPAGIASVVLQSQAFFTIVFAAILLRESISGWQLAGLAVAALGLGLVGLATGAEGAAAIPLSAFLLTLVAAAFWGISNIVVRRAAASQGERLDMLGMVVWSSLIPPIPLFLLALLMGSPGGVARSVASLSPTSLFAIAYLAFGATLFGYGAWSKLLSRHPAGTVAPLSLLVPITGLLTAMLVLGEKLSLLQWSGCLVIIAGLLVFNYGSRIIRGGARSA